MSFFLCVLEMLNPEQKRKRAEKLRFLQELNQRLFPNQGGTSPGGNIPPGQGSPGMGPNGKNCMFFFDNSLDK